MPEATDKNYAVYLSAAAGAFLIGFGDILKNGGDTTHVTVLRIADVLRTYFSPLLGQGWVALLLLALIGALLCWIRRPPTKTDSFALGLSVFAVLTAAAPIGAPTQQAAAVSNPVVSSTHAFELISSADAAADQKETWPYYFEVKDEGNRLRGKNIIYSLYDESESSLIGNPIDTTSRIVEFNLPVGVYVLYVECSICQRTRIPFKVDPKIQASNLIIPPSSISLGLQRLFRPGVSETEDLPDARAQVIARQFSEMHQQ